MKIIKTLIIFILSLVLIVGAIAVGGYFFVKSKYDIDLIRTVKQLKILSETVDENALCPNAFSDSDMVDVQEIVNQSVEDFITYTTEHGYEVNFDDLPEEMRSIITLTDKQVGALIQTIIKQEVNGKVSIANKDVPVALKQVKFSPIENSQNTTINTVFMADLTPLKDTMMDKFPFTYLKKFVPDALYLSSTIDIIKGDNPFEYTVKHNSLTINNLSKDDTEDLFRTLDVVLKIGKAETLNLQIGETITNALIGNENANGLAYSLRSIGAIDYEFSTKNNDYVYSVNRQS